MGEFARSFEQGLLGPAYDRLDADALIQLVGPRYLAHFAEVVAPRIAPSPSPSVLVVGTLASSLVPSVRAVMPKAHVRVVEPSAALAECVRVGQPGLEVHTLGALPVPLRDRSCSHAVLLHPLSSPRDRRALLSELLRLLVPGGQLLVCTPLRGSFPELFDLLREYAIKHDATQVADAVELASQARPTPETFGADLEDLGFCDVEVDLQLWSVPFESGRDFEAHPLFRLVLAPDLARQLLLPPEALSEALLYVREAMAKYWAELPLDLSVNVGCVVGRKPLDPGG